MKLKKMKKNNKIKIIKLIIFNMLLRIQNNIYYFYNIGYINYVVKAIVV